ncbi:uncharacterized protein [Panulirus ornatus]|uniref:uncharacterized protein n=1 Tax=Panulirus ornatus TaxID=150431 RepID=UPI003A8A504C
MGMAGSTQRISQDFYERVGSILDKIDGEFCCEQQDVGPSQEGREWWSLSSGYHSSVATSEVSVGEPGVLDASLTSTDTSDDEDDSAWGEDEWPANRALPLPKWGCQRPELHLATLEEHQTFLGRVRQHLRHILASHSYDTVSNFVMFGKEYVSSRVQYPSLDDFYREYDPPLLPGRHTCVGLTCLLETSLSGLEPHYPGLKDAIYKVSCEEEVDQVAWYCQGDTPPTTCEKEHVLLCVRVRVCGRVGLVLLDPGFHVGEPITVMEDGQEPQSGAVIGSTARTQVVRTYRYRCWPDNTAYVAWEVTEERETSPPRQHTSLIHVARPFLSGIDVAERRNLAYPFKTLVAREPSGRLTCGLYFPVRECRQTCVTLFHQVAGQPHHLKVPLNYFLEETTREDQIEAAVAAVAEGTSRTPEDLRLTLAAVAHLLRDQDFLQQLTQLNEAIDSISKDN